LEQAYPDQPVVVIDALDRVSVELELADDGGWEVNPAGVQLGKSDGLLAGLAQSLSQPLLLSVSEHHRWIVGQTGIGLQTIDRASERRPQRCPRRVGARIAAEAMRVEQGQRPHNHKVWLPAPVRMSRAC
jgi:hypothetical protein